MTAIDKAIDLGRVGLSKSLMTNPCERKGAYSEFVRDAQGRRLRFPMPEKVLFGSALDSALSYIAYQERAGEPWTMGRALNLAVERAGDMDASEEIDWPTFGLQVENALRLFYEAGMGKDRVGRSAHDWLLDHIAEPEFRIQGDDGRTLRAGDIIGTPDFMCRHVIDVKTSARAYDEAKFVRSAEMPTYALLYAAEHDGTLPESLAYLVYVRVTRPYWQVWETTATADHVALGRLHAERWRKGLATGDPDSFSFDTTYCGECGFRDAIPDADFDGCPIGRLVNREAVA